VEKKKGSFLPVPWKGKKDFPLKGEKIKTKTHITPPGGKRKKKRAYAPVKRK